MLTDALLYVCLHALLYCIMPQQVGSSYGYTTGMARFRESGKILLAIVSRPIAVMAIIKIVAMDVAMYVRGCS